MTNSFLSRSAAGVGYATPIDHSLTRRSQHIRQIQADYVSRHVFFIHHNVIVAGPQPKNQMNTRSSRPFSHGTLVYDKGISEDEISARLFLLLLAGVDLRWRHTPSMEEERLVVIAAGRAGCDIRGASFTAHMADKSRLADGSLRGRLAADVASCRDQRYLFAP